LKQRNTWCGSEPAWTGRIRFVCFAWVLLPASTTGSRLANLSF
jgi:hypothetical protein